MQSGFAWYVYPHSHLHVHSSLALEWPFWHTISRASKSHIYTMLSLPPEASHLPQGFQETVNTWPM
jgi:hypothetical protein